MNPHKAFCRDHHAMRTLPTLEMHESHTNRIPNQIVMNGRRTLPRTSSCCYLSKEWTISEEIGISKEKHSRRNLEWISKLSPRKENTFYDRKECKETGKGRIRVLTLTLCKKLRIVGEVKSGLQRKWRQVKGEGEGDKKRRLMKEGRAALWMREEEGIWEWMWNEEW